MRTRSRIGILKENGSVESVYVHHDGYLEYMGALLLNYYNSKEKAQAIVDLGDISFLGKTLNYSENYLGCETTRNYKTWQKEDSPKRTDISEKNYLQSFGNSWEEYMYLYKNNKWYVYEGYKYTKLTPLEDIEECKDFNY